MMKWVGIHVLSDTYKKIRILAALEGTSYGKVVARVVDEAFEKTGMPLPNVNEGDEDVIEDSELVLAS